MIKKHLLVFLALAVFMTPAYSSLKAQDLAEQAKKHKATLEKTPHDMRVRQRYAELLSEAGDYAEAKRQISIILANAPNNMAAMISLARIQIAEGDITSARETLTSILEKSPAHREAGSMMASISESNKLEETLEITEQQKAAVLSQIASEKEQAVFEEISKEEGEAAALSHVFTPYRAGQEKALNIFRLPMIDVPGTNKPLKFADMLSKKTFSPAVNLFKADYFLYRGDSKKAFEYLQKSQASGLERLDAAYLDKYAAMRVLSAAYSENFDVLDVSQNAADSNSPVVKMASGLHAQIKEIPDKISLNKFLGGLAVANEHYKVAEIKFEQALSEGDEDPLILSMLAELQVRNGSYAKAEKSFMQLAKIEKDNPEVFLNLARFYLTADFNYGKFRTYAAISANLRKETDPRLEYFKALADYGAGFGKQAEEVLEKLIEAYPYSEFAKVCSISLARIKSGESPADFIESLALPGSSKAPAASYAMWAADNMERASWFAAAEEFAKAGSVAGEARAWFAAGAELAKLGDMEESKNFLSQGVALAKQRLQAKPNDAEANLSMALYLSSAGDHAKSLEHVSAGLEDPEPMPEAMMKLIKIAESLGN